MQFHAVGIPETAGWSSQQCGIALYCIWASWIRRWNRFTWRLDTTSWVHTSLWHHWMGPWKILALGTTFCSLTRILVFNYSPLSRLRILNLEYSPLSKWPNPAAGLFPDYMHIIHLAVAVDSICSLLLDLSDPCSGETRENKLVALWESYKEWADAERNLVS